MLVFELHCPFCNRGAVSPPINYDDLPDVTPTVSVDQWKILHIGCALCRREREIIITKLLLQYRTATWNVVKPSPRELSIKVTVI